MPYIQDVVVERCGGIRIGMEAALGVLEDWLSPGRRT